MKCVALFFASVAVVGAFAPLQSGRSNTQLSESLFDKIFNMDLYNPVKDNNLYGARAKKNLKVGAIGAKSYVPNGLTAAQYTKIREAEAKKKAASYKKNVSKAGVFEDYTDFYIKRGTDTSQAWKKSVTLGHRMAKNKYDFDTFENGKKYDGGALTSSKKGAKAKAKK